MMRTGRISARRAVDGAVLAMTMTMMTARVRRTRRALRKGPGREGNKGWEGEREGEGEGNR